MSRHQLAPHDSTMTAAMTSDPCSRNAHDGHDGQPERAGLRLASRALTTLLAVAAFGLSYSHTVAWFAAHGQQDGKYILAAIPEISLIMCVITRACEQPKALRAWLIGALAVGSFGITITANLAAASAGAGGVVAALVAPLAAIITMALEVTHGSTTPPARSVAPAGALTYPTSASEPVAARWLTQPSELAAQGEPVSAPVEPAAPVVRHRDIPLDQAEQLKGQTVLFDSPEHTPEKKDPTPIGKSADKAAAVQWIKSQLDKPTRQEIEKRYRVSKATANRWLNESTAA
jgi:hypothetical protein